MANPGRRNGDHGLNATALKGMTAFSIGGGAPLNSPEELEAALRQIGAARYHNLHPFHRPAARRQAEQGAGAGVGA